MKKITFFTVLGVTILMIVLEVGSLGIAPFLIALFLMYRSVYQNKNVVVPLLVLSITMALLNVAIESVVDVIMWVLIAITFRKKS